jgi:hypothetical protein
MKINSWYIDNFASQMGMFHPVNCLTVARKVMVYLIFIQLCFSVSRVTDKKVQLNTDLLKHRNECLYAN